MTLEVFALLDADGCHNDGIYIFSGKPSDLAKLAQPLQDFYALNRRQKKVEALAIKILKAAKLPEPLVRLEKAEGRILMDTLATLVSEKPVKPAHKKVYDRLAESLLVY